MVSNFAVQIEPVTVKAACAPWFGSECVRERNAVELDVRLGERTLSLPQAIIAPKTGQAIVHAHTSAYDNDELLCRLDNAGRVFKVLELNLRHPVRIAIGVVSVR
jgi:hypothetical protein